MIRALETIRTTPGRAPAGRHMTEAEFVEWCDEETHAEWVDGELIVLAPENSRHNFALGFLLHLFEGFVVHHDLGRVLFEKVQIRLAKIRRRREPDLIFVAKSRLDIVKTNHIEGAPDLVIEVVSPDSVSRDYRDKFNDYQAAGVREYWIVDLLAERVEAYTLNRQRRFVLIPEIKRRIKSVVLPGFYLQPARLWQDPLPNWLEILREMGLLR
jgi:Uma2 family endonuclease